MLCRSTLPLLKKVPSAFLNGSCRQNELLQHSNEALEAEKEAISQETVSLQCSWLAYGAGLQAVHVGADLTSVLQAKLKAQQSMLQKRLQQALQMHLQPRTSVNTESPADKTLRLLDSLLQVWSCCLDAFEKTTVADPFCHC